MGVVLEDDPDIPPMPPDPPPEPGPGATVDELLAHAWTVIEWQEALRPRTAFLQARSLRHLEALKRSIGQA
jgi:hypothetical protein